MAQPDSAIAPLELPGWKTAVSWAAAILIASLFLISGLWEITDIPAGAVRLHQALVPQGLSLPAAFALAIGNTFIGVLLLVPRFRKWGSWLASAALVLFLAYFAINYNTLRGEECTCFPWVKRVVGPAFFIGDGVMLVLAIAAGWWARAAHSLRSAALILAAVCVFAGVSYGVQVTRQSGTKAPESITVDNKPFSLQQGKIFIYFFDPECMHCNDAAKRMSKYNWGDTKVIGVPTNVKQFAQEFMQSTGLRAPISNDLALLKQKFPFVSTPAGVAIENGRERAAVTQFEDTEPGATLKKLGFVY